MRRLRYAILTFTVVRAIVNTLHRMVYPFLTVFSRSLGVDLELLSLGVSARSAVGALGPFLATLSDGRGRKAGILTGVSLFVAGALLVVIYPTYPAFLASLALTALSKTFFEPSALAYLGDRVPYERRGRAIGFTEFGWSLSFIVGVPLAGFLVARRGWQAPFPWLAGLGVLSVAVLAWILPPDKDAPQVGTGLKQNLRAVFGDPGALLLLSVGALFSAANEMINLVFGAWLEETLGVQILALGAASLVIGMAELCAESLVTGLTDRLGKPRAVALGLVLNSAAGLALPWLGQSYAGALVGLFFFYLAFEFALVSMIPLLTEVSPSARATLLASHVAGFSLGRSAAALFAARLYGLGFGANVVAVALLNGLALVALMLFRSLRRQY